MSDRATAYAMMALLLVLFWSVLMGIVGHAVWSENNPTHEWGEQFEPAWMEQQRTMPTPYPPKVPPTPRPLAIDNEDDCVWACGRSGLYGRWRDGRCVCGVAP